MGVIKWKLTPPRILVLSFIILIIIGTFLLSLPVAVEKNYSISIIDAFFTATSAIAVTGLIVVDTSKTFSTFGEVVILMLIQIGGLGFMTVSTLLALIVGKRISFRERLLIREQINSLSLGGIVKLTKTILIITFIIELISSLILGLYWARDYGLVKGLYLGFFHSVSAFCNAGFDLFSNSMINYKGDILVNIMIVSLFIIGGLGFLVISEILTHFKWKKFSLHSKLVLSVTFFMLILGFLIVLLLEFNNSLVDFSLKEKLLCSFFQGATPRTAGFNSISINNLQYSTIFIIMLLMFIGASSGSTGGGIKITTFFVVLLAVIATIKNNDETVIFGRKINNEIVFKSLTIIIISLFLIAISCLILLITESAAFEVILFEVISAFGTVGLSLGLTSELTFLGKIIISITMFIGRVGPLTLAFAFLQKSGKDLRLHYPEEKIIVG